MTPSPDEAPDSLEDEELDTSPELLAAFRARIDEMTDSEPMIMERLPESVTPLTRTLPDGRELQARPSDEELARAADPQNWTDFTVTFFMYTRDIASAHALAEALQSRGWESERLGLQEQGPLVVRGYRRLDGDQGIDSLAAFDEEMEMMAERHGASYDGSGVSIRQPEDQE